MSGAKLWAAVLGGLLLTLSSIDRRSGTPSPSPAGNAALAAVKYRSEAADTFRGLSDRIAAREFETELDEAKAASAGMKQVAKTVDAAFAAMYAATRELPEEKKAPAHAAFYREFGDAMEK